MVFLKSRVLSLLAPVCGILLLLGGCQSNRLPEIRDAAPVDLERFMGDWFVIASIPTFFERDAYNAVERYALKEDGRIDTTFIFRRGGYDGEQHEMNPVATVREDTGNAIWGMQFLWPFKADFRIVYLDEDYSQTIIGRQKRDYVWIMAREPHMDEADYAALLDMLEKEGYTISDIQRVPQCWQAPCDPL